MVSGKFVKAMSVTALAVMVVGLVGASTAGELTDSRDVKKYKTVKIGNQTWMAENLNYQPSSGKSWCYENNDSNCNKYGRLYDWETAKMVCPSGWHLPGRNEWDNLAATVGGKRDSSYIREIEATLYYWNPSGKKLKSTSGWNNNGNGTDDFGFSALPGGNRNYGDGSFYDAGNNGYWWAATEDDSGDAYYRYMYYYNENVNEYYNGKSSGLSVRCLQD